PPSKHSLPLHATSYRFRLNPPSKLRFHTASLSLYRDISRKRTRDRLQKGIRPHAIRTKMDKIPTARWGTVSAAFCVGRVSTSLLLPRNQNRYASIFLSLRRLEVQRVGTADRNM